MPHRVLDESVTAEVVAIFGPTASGKSAVAEFVADRLGTELVSADALQVYRGLPILTNQPARPTRLVGCISLQESMSVGAYAALAHAAIDGLVEAHGAAVVSGGTGLYLRAALAELDIPPAAAADARARWERRYDADPTAAHELLRKLDPLAAASVHPNDRRRVVRALELAEARGLRSCPSETASGRPSWRRPTAVFGLEVPPDELQQRIRRRAEAMFAAGVVAEVQAAIGSGVSATAEQALGLREIATLPTHEACERMVVRTRQYAAYQRKWMRRIPGIVLVDGTRPPEEVADAILEVVESQPR